MAYPESWGIRQLSNWGRWGKDDQKGTANFITPQVVAKAAREAREGKVFSCAIPFDRGGPVYPGAHALSAFLRDGQCRGRRLGNGAQERGGVE